MHLDVLDSGQRRPARAAMWAAKNLLRSPIDDVGKTSLYRPALFGRNWLALVREVLRGPSEWSPAERELIAAFVSHTNRCLYCVAIHSEMATLGLGREIGPDSLDGWRTGDLDPKIKAVFGLLEELQSGAEAVSAARIDAVRAEGVSDEAIADALYVAFVFNLVNRLADALGFSWRSESETAKSAVILNRMGYKIPAILLR